MKKYFVSLIVLLVSLAGCAPIFKYRPPAPKNLRMTPQEKTELEKLTQTASSPNKPLDKDKIMKSYLAVTKYDGIDDEEAVVLAQSELLFRNLEKRYQVAKPKITALTDHQVIVSFPGVNSQLETKLPPGIQVLVGRASGKVTLQTPNGK